METPNGMAVIALFVFAFPFIIALTVLVSLAVGHYKSGNREKAKSFLIPIALILVLLVLYAIWIFSFIG